MVGDGTAQLLAPRRRRCSSPRDELVTPWPPTGSTPGGGPPRPRLRRAGRGVLDPNAILRAVNDRTRAVALCNPNDPTGELHRRPRRRSRSCSRRCPSGSCSCSTRPCASSTTGEDRDAALALCEHHPPTATRLPHVLEGLGPRRPAGAATRWAARARSRCSSSSSPSSASTSWRRRARWRPCATAATCSPPAASRSSPSSGRASPEALPGLGLQAPASEANLLWLRHDGSNGGELADRLRRQGIVVAPGGGARGPRARPRRGPGD